MTALSVALGLGFAAAWDAWRRWLAHRAAGYEQQIADLAARDVAITETLDDLLARHRKLHDQVQGIVIRRVGGGR